MLAGCVSLSKSTEPSGEEVISLSWAVPPGFSSHLWVSLQDGWVLLSAHAVGEELARTVASGTSFPRSNEEICKSLSNEAPCLYSCVDHVLRMAAFLSRFASPFGSCIEGLEVHLSIGGSGVQLPALWSELP